MWRLNRLTNLFFLDEDTGGAGGGSAAPGTDAGDNQSSSGEQSGGTETPAGEEGSSSGKKPNTEGSGLPTYLAQASPEVREKYSDYFKNHAKLNDLLLAHVKVTDTLKRSIVVPDKENSTPEEIAAFYKKMDIPADETGYALTADKNIPEMDSLSKLVAKNAHDLGLTKAQGQGMWKTISGVVGEGIKTQVDQNLAAEAELPAKLLKAFEGEKDKVAAAENFYKAFLVRLGSKDINKNLADSGVLYNPSFVMRMAEIEEQLGDETMVSSVNRFGKNGKSPGTMGNYDPAFLAYAEGDEK